MELCILMINPGEFASQAINPECLNLYVNNREEFENKAKEWTKKYAIE